MIDQFIYGQSFLYSFLYMYIQYFDDFATIMKILVIVSSMLILSLNDCMAGYTCGEGELQVKVPPSMFFRYINEERVITSQNKDICMKMRHETDPRKFMIAPPDDQFHCVITDAFNNPKWSAFHYFTEAIDILISKQPTFSQEDYILVTTDINRYKNKYSCQPLNMTKLYNAGVSIWVVGVKKADFVDDGSRDVADEAVEEKVDEAVSNEVDRVDRPRKNKKKNKPRKAVPNITELAVSVEKSAQANTDDDDDGEKNVDKTELAPPIEKPVDTVGDDADGGGETSAFVQEKQPSPVSDNNEPMYADEQQTVDDNYNTEYDTYDDYVEKQQKGGDESADTANIKTIDITDIEKEKSKENKKTVPLNNKSGNENEEYNVKFIEPTHITNTADNQKEGKKSISQFHMALIIIAGFLLFAFIVVTCRFIYIQLSSKYSRGDRAFIRGSRTAIPVRA